MIFNHKKISNRDFLEAVEIITLEQLLVYVKERECEVIISHGEKGQWDLVDFDDYAD